MARDQEDAYFTVDRVRSSYCESWYDEIRCVFIFTMVSPALVQDKIDKLHSVFLLAFFCFCLCNWDTPVRLPFFRSTLHNAI